MIRVLLVDDEAMVRAGFRLILSLEDDIEVVGEAADGLAAIAEAAHRQPDVVLMDVPMPRLDGVRATERIVTGEPGAPRVVMVTTFERDDYVFAALRAGASGFVLKNSPPEDLVTAVRTVAGGGALLAPSVTRRLITEFAAAAPQPAKQAALADLSEREREVLILVARGFSNGEIADALVLGEATVKTHVSNVLGKLGLRDRVQAAIFAYEAGLVRAGGA
jgi:DNA-binding NarL/FixJ family response regulator